MLDKNMLTEDEIKKVSGGVQGKKRVYDDNVRIIEMYCPLCKTKTKFNCVSGTRAICTRGCGYTAKV